MKLSKLVGLFLKVRHLLPLQGLLAMYRSLFEPHLNYCNIIWNNTYPTYTEKLLTLQKKAIRAISWSTKYSPSNALFREFGLLKLPECNYYHNACTMYSVVNRLNPKLCELIPLLSSDHQYDTRNKQLLKGKYRKLKCTKFSICYQGPEIWKQLTDNLKQSPSLSIFKRNLKLKLLERYCI